MHTSADILSPLLGVSDLEIKDGHLKIDGLLFLLRGCWGSDSFEINIRKCNTDRQTDRQKKKTDRQTDRHATMLGVHQRQ